MTAESSPVKNTLFTLIAAVALTLLSVIPAGATIIGGTVTGGSAYMAGGTFIKLTPPLSNPRRSPDTVGNDTYQTPNLYGFDEDQNILLLAELGVDVGTNPLPAGTTVASHYVFFDPGPVQTMIGTVDFDADILAIITSTDLLLASDFLASAAVHYLNPKKRGLERRDSVTISGPREILFDASASTPGDYVRVLTAFSAAAVPGPSTASLFAVGLAAMVALAKRFRYLS